jgi:hypothetical protein
MDAINHQVRLAARPVGQPKPSDWAHTSEPVGGSIDDFPDTLRKLFHGENRGKLVLKIA